MQIHAKRTVRERWEAIVTEYTKKGAYAQTDLHARFLESKCPEKSNVREFLDALRIKREELASVGVSISEQDYISTILSSLPYALSNFASTALAAARVFAQPGATQTADPNTLITMISEEYERQKTQHLRRGGKAKADDKDKDEAMAVSSSSKGKGGKGDRKSKVTCWNCGKKGHFKNQCPDPPKASTSSSKDAKDEKGKDKKDSDKANVVEEEEYSDSDGVFAVFCETESEAESDDSMPAAGTETDLTSFAESEADSMPVLRTLSDSSADETDSDGGLDNRGGDSDDVEGGRDWFSEVGSDAGDFADEEWESDGSLASQNPSDAPRVEIYDSGTNRHISPYQDDFLEFQPIPPRQLRAANGVNSSNLLLNEVLYSPEVGYTLVSIGKLDELGFKSTFAEGYCTITDPNGVQVGKVPKNAKGLYRVEHDAADLV
ncbi:hypothetical protein GALMADRAFT_260373, partial [Galerina marginata CBS 339.88]